MIIPGENLINKLLIGQCSNKKLWIFGAFVYFGFYNRDIF